MFEYVPVPTAIVLSTRTSLIAHYARLRALAWQNAFDHTDPLPEDQLYAWLGMSRRQFYNVINECKEAGWVKLERADRARVIISFPVQLIAQESLVKLVKLNRRGEETEEEKLDSSAINCTKVQLIAQMHDELCHLGVHKSIAKALADEYPPEFIKDKIEIYKWAVREGAANGPGYLVKSIQQKWEIPSGYDSNDHADGQTQLIFPDLTKWVEASAPADDKAEITPILLDVIPGTEFTPHQLWNQICQAMEAQLTRDKQYTIYQRYFWNTTAISFEGNKITIITTSKEAAEFLAHRAIYDLRRILPGITNIPIDFNFIYEPEDINVIRS